jgi:2-iminobutanoate/2-iminopropanoate deaminase
MGPYSVATEANGFVFVSGQVAINTSTGEREPADVTAQAHRVMQNLGSILSDLGLSYADIVKTNIFLADIGSFSEVNEAYGAYVDDEPPARSTFQAGALPGGFLVEMEVVAAR